MSLLRLRVQIDKGSESVPLSRIVSFTEKLDGFLRALGQDIGIDESDNQWCASRFKDGSFMYTAGPVGDYSKAIQQRFNVSAAAFLAGDENTLDELRVSDKARVEFAQVAHAARNGSTRLGLYRSDKATRPKWFALQKGMGEVVSSKVRRSHSYLGSVQGYIATLHAEANPPHIWIREFPSQQRVRCNVGRAHIPRIAELLKDPDALVAIWGRVTVDKIDGGVELQAGRFRKCPTPLSDREFNSIIGMRPNMTGDLSTAEFIDLFRGDAD
jgi:hypothetical protein